MINCHVDKTSPSMKTGVFSFGRDLLNHTRVWLSF